MRVILIFLFSTCIIFLSFSITTTWTGSSNVWWNTAGNWSNGVPTSSDDVIIPDVSGASGNFPKFTGTGSNINCRNLTINSGATLTLSSTNSKALYVYGDIVVNGTIDGTYATLVLYSGTNGISGTPTDVSSVFLYARNGSTFTLNSNWSINNLQTQDVGSTFNVASGVTLTTNFVYNRNDCFLVLLGTGALDVNSSCAVLPEARSTFTMNSGTLYCSTNLGANSSATFNAGTGTVVLDGSTSTEIRYAYTFYNLTINKDATDDVVSCQDSDDDVTVSNNLTITEGTLSNIDADFTVSGNTTMDGGKFIASSSNGPVTFTGNLTLNGSAIIDHQGTTSAGDIDLSGDLDINGTAGIQSSTDTDRRLDLLKTPGGNVYVEATAAANSSTSNWIVRGQYTFNDDITVGSFLTGYNQSSSVTVVTGKTLTITDDFYNQWGSSFTLSGTAGLTTNGSVTQLGIHTGSTFTLNSGTLDVNAGTLTVASNAGATVNFNSGNINVAGDYQSGSGTINWSTSTLSFDGSANSVINDALSCYNLTIAKDATDDIVSCVDADADIAVSNNFTITEGTLQPTLAELDVTGTSTITDGELIGGAANITLGGNVTMDNDAYMTVSTSTSDIRVDANLTMNGTSGVRNTGGATTFIRFRGNSSNTISCNTPANSSSARVVMGNASFNYTLNSDWQIAYLQLSNSGGAGATIAVADGNTLTVDGDINAYHTSINLTLSGSGSLDCNGSIASGSVITMGTGILSIATNFTNDHTFTDGAGTVTFDGSANSVIDDPDGIEFYNLTINKDATDDVVSCNDADADITVSNNLTITEGTLSTTDADLSVTGTTTLTDGKLIAAEGATTAKTTLTGDLTMNNDAILDDQTSITTASTDAIDLYGSLDLNGTSSITSTTLSSATINLRGGTKTINAEVGVTCSLADMNFYEDYTIQDNWTVRGLYAWSSTGVITVADGFTVTADDLYNNADGTITLNGSGSLTITDDAWLCIESGTTFTMNTGTVDIADRLQIGSGANGTFNGNTGTIQVGGNLVMSGTINEGNSTFELDGSVNQNISGTTVKWHDLVIKNTSGDVGLNADGTVNGTLTMTTGDLIIATGVTLTSDGTDAPGFSGGSASSHIVTSGTGVISDTYASTTKVTYPIGDGTNYRPVALTPSSATSETWTLSYTASAHADTDVDGSGLDHVSQEEFWTIDRVGSVDAIIELTWTSENNVTDYTNLRIAHYDGSTDWDMIDSTPIGNNTSGVLTSDAAVSTFSPFTIGSITTANPLPVEYLLFDAKYEQKYNYVLIEWATYSEKNNDYFIIQKSINGFDWKNIDTVVGNGNSILINEYGVIDRDVNFGFSYYRLKQVDFDGNYSLSNIIVVEIRTNDIIFPNPSTGIIYFKNEVENYEYNLYDVTGRKISSGYILNNKLDFSKNPKGFYYLIVDDKRINILLH